ncbi:hypothetical protein [Kitasatospora sp. McL0602]|uniref:hypothetical protein n=1 Tax=Kitasatospora sp. McL0602 TaxID=3439530 RepID=UPI003F88F474
MAELEPGRVAVAKANNPRTVLVGTPADLAELKKAFADGRFDFLIAREVPEEAG